MEKAELLRELFGVSHEWLEGTVADLTAEQAAWQPPGNAVPAGAHYVHHLLSEDFFVNHLFRGQAPLMASTFAGTAGFSEPMPMGPWADWARRVTVDLPAVRTYAQAVYASTDAYLSGLTVAEMDREVDMSAMGMGMVKVSYLIDQILTNAAAHCGEISCIKGLQGQKGYPF
jgi:hypothetical protein